MPDIISLTSYSGALCGLAAAVFSYLKDYNNRKNRAFALFSLGMSLLLLSLGSFPGGGSGLGGFVYYGILLFAVFNFFYFISVWLKNGAGKKAAILLSSANALAFLIFAAAGASPFSGSFLRSSLPFYLFLAAISSFLLYIIFILLYRHQKSYALRRAKLKYLILGSFLLYFGLLGYFFEPVLAKDYFFVTFPPLFAAMLAFAYPVLSRHFLELTAVLRKIFVFSSSFFSVSIISIALGYQFSSHWPELSSSRDFFVIMLAVFIFAPIRNFYSWLAKTYIFSYYYSMEKVVSELNQRLKATLKIEEIYGIIEDLAERIFQPKFFIVLSYNEKRDNFYPVYQRNAEIAGKNQAVPASRSDAELIANDSAASIEEMADTGRISGGIFEMLSAAKADLCLPVKIKGRPAGMIVLGPKSGGNMYDSKDMQTFGIIGAQASLAIENALMYQETRNFNQKLEEEVAAATKELREANEKLMRLDKAKSEFISIASHQLRTPLTVIKGYISMMMEGNFGPMSAAISDSVKKVYDSNERLILLVENLLNISRIESGNLRFDMRRMDLEELVISAIDEMQDTAQKRGKELVYKPQSGPLEPLTADPDKIRHVILNYIDNAVKYSEKGEIEISLKQEKDKIIFSIKDRGIGLTDEEMSNLFRKFYRGAQTPLIYTEGTGLGLYVAKQIIEAHKGHVWAESAGPNQGSTFYFSLPKGDNVEVRSKK